MAHSRWMASDPKTVAYVVDQASAGGPVNAKAMFGEYGLYLDGRMVALVCDDRLYVKPTMPGRDFVPDAEEEQPYPGAKPHLLVDAERWDDREWLSELFRLTAAALPAPKPKAVRKKA